MLLVKKSATPKPLSTSLNSLALDLLVF